MRVILHPHSTPELFVAELPGGTRLKAQKVPIYQPVDEVGFR